MLIFFGTFLRGPNWNFFGPYEYLGSRTKPAALNNINISDMSWNNDHAAAPARRRGHPDCRFGWSRSIANGWASCWSADIFVILPALLRATVFKRMYENMGVIRYAIMVMLLLFMALMPIKMVLALAVQPEILHLFPGVQRQPLICAVTPDEEKDLLSTKVTKDTKKKTDGILRVLRDLRGQFS